MSNKVLVISAHGDDGHLGAAGTMLKLSYAGYEIHYLVLSLAESSVPEGFPKDIVGAECLEASKILGIDSTRVYFEREFATRLFPESRQEILELLIWYRDELNPSIVFTNSTMDVHQDHRVVSEETIRAFRKCATIYGYDFPWNLQVHNHLNVFVPMSPETLESKVKAVSCYKSQMMKPNNCTNQEYITGLAAVRGNQCNSRYAEAFEGIITILK